MKKATQQSMHATGKRPAIRDRKMSDKRWKQCEADEKKLNDKLAEIKKKEHKAKLAREARGRARMRDRIGDLLGREIKFPSRINLRRIRQNRLNGLAKYDAEEPELARRIEAGKAQGKVRIIDFVDQIKNFIEQRGLPRPKTTGDLASQLRYFDWRLDGIVPRPRNQGKCGSCWAFAATEAFESRLMYNVNKYKMVDRKKGGLITQAGLSVQGVFNCVTGGSCKRGNPFNAFDHFIKNGARLLKIDERGFPMDAFEFIGRKGPCRNKRGVIKALAWDFVFERNPIAAPRSKPAIHKMKKALLDHGPLAVMVMKGGKKWDNYREEQGVWNEDPRSRAFVNHVFLLTGWDDDKKAWIVLNSAGPDWGGSCVDMAKVKKHFPWTIPNAFILRRERGCMYIQYGASSVGRMAIWVETSRLNDEWLERERNKMAAKSQSAAKKDERKRPGGSGKTRRIG